jgi:hypothetical protein
MIVMRKIHLRLAAEAQLERPLAAWPTVAFRPMRPATRILFAFQSISPGDYFEFTADRVRNGDYRVHLKYK